MKNKKLKIIGVPVNKAFFGKQNNFDVLELSLPFMKSNTINRVDVEDFFSRQDFETEMEYLKKSIKSLFLKCDEEFSGFMNSPFEKSGYWLTHRLSNLMVLHKLSQKIEEKYDDIEIVVSKNFKFSKFEECSIQDRRFNNINPSQGFSVTMGFLIKMLPDSKISFVEEENINFILKLKKIQKKIMRSHLFILNKSKNLRKVIEKKFLKKKFRKKILIIEEGYDLDILKNYSNIFKKFSFNRSLKKINKKNFFNDTNKKFVLKTIEDFLDSNFPKLKKELLMFFRSYIDNVVLFLPDIEKSFKKAINRNETKGIIFSTGASDILQKTICEVANKMNLNIYFLRHEGIELSFLYDNYVDQYCEKDVKIKRIQFLYNKNETNFFPKHKNVKFHLIEPLLYVDKRKRRKKNKKIIYCSGPCAYFGFKNLRDQTTDREKQLLSKSLSRISLKNLLKIDIKLHPSSWKESLKFYDNLDLFPGSKVIFDGKTSDLLKKYNLLIIDIVATKVLSEGIFNNMEIILYKPKDINLRKENTEALKSRVHIVETIAELEEKIFLYSNGELNSKIDSNIFKEKFYNFDTKMSNIEKTIHFLEN